MDLFLRNVFVQLSCIAPTPLPTAPSVKTSTPLPERYKKEGKNNTAHPGNSDWTGKKYRRGWLSSFSFSTQPRSFFLIQPDAITTALLWARWGRGGREGRPVCHPKKKNAWRLVPCRTSAVVLGPYKVCSSGGERSGEERTCWSLGVLG